MKTFILLVITLLASSSLFAEAKIQRIYSERNPDEMIEISVSELAENPDHILIKLSYHSEDGVSESIKVLTRDQLTERVQDAYKNRAGRNALITGGVAGTVGFAAPALWSRFITGLWDELQNIRFQSIPHAVLLAPAYVGLLFYYPFVYIYRKIGTKEKLMVMTASGLIMGTLGAGSAYLLSRKGDKENTQLREIFQEDEDSFTIDFNLEKAYNKMLLLTK